MVNFTSTATFEITFFRAAHRLSLWRTHSSFQQHRDWRDECFFQILDTSTQTRPVQRAKVDILSKNNNNATLLTLSFGVRADCCLHSHGWHYMGSIGDVTCFFLSSSFLVGVHGYHRRPLGVILIICETWEWWEHMSRAEAPLTRWWEGNG